MFPLLAAIPILLGTVLLSRSPPRNLLEWFPMLLGVKCVLTGMVRRLFVSRAAGITTHFGIVYERLKDIELKFLALKKENEQLKARLSGQEAEEDDDEAKERGRFELLCTGVCWEDVSSMMETLEDNEVWMSKLRFDVRVEKSNTQHESRDSGSGSGACSS
jgi:hypothetical protein